MNKMENADVKSLQQWSRGIPGLRVRTIRSLTVYQAWKWGENVRLDYKGNSLTGWRCKFITPEEFNTKYFLIETDPEG